MLKFFHSVISNMGIGLTTLTNWRRRMLEGEFHDVSKLDEKLTSVNIETFKVGSGVGPVKATYENCMMKKEVCHTASYDIRASIITTRDLPSRGQPK